MKTGIKLFMVLLMALSLGFVMSGCDHTKTSQTQIETDTEAQTESNNTQVEEETFIAYIGKDRKVEIGSDVELVPYWNENTELQYIWTMLEQPNGSSTNLDTLFGASTGFNVDEFGNYKVNLLVRDPETGDSVSDIVMISTLLHANDFEIKISEGNASKAVNWKDMSRVNNPASQANVSGDGTYGSCSISDDMLTYIRDNLQYMGDDQCTLRVFDDTDEITIVVSIRIGGLGRLYGTAKSGSSDSIFMELDPETGALIQTIGNVGYIVNGLEYDHTRDKFFASTARSDEHCGACLLEIDPITGAGTVIGSSGQFTLLLLTANSGGEMFGWLEPSADDPVRVDVITGAATVIGDAGVGTARHGLAFDASDTLYMHNIDGRVYTINTTTGAATWYTSSSGTAHHGDFDFATGYYVGINSTSGPRFLVFKDGTTFNTIKTVPTVDNLHTITFVND